MGAHKQAKSPSLRRYTPSGKEQAVRLVRELRDQLGTEHGTVGRVAHQLAGRQVDAGHAGTLDEQQAIQLRGDAHGSGPVRVSRERR